MTKAGDEVLFVAKYYSYRLLFWESESTIDMNDRTIAFCCFEV